MRKTRFDADSNKSQHAEKRMIESKINLMTKKSTYIIIFLINIRLKLVYKRYYFNFVYKSVRLGFKKKLQNVSATWNDSK